MFPSPVGHPVPSRSPSPMDVDQTEADISSSMEVDPLSPPNEFSAPVPVRLGSGTHHFVHMGHPVTNEIRTALTVPSMTLPITTSTAPSLPPLVTTPPVAPGAGVEAKPEPLSDARDVQVSLYNPRLMIPYARAKLANGQYEFITSATRLAPFDTDGRQLVMLTLPAGSVSVRFGLVSDSSHTDGANRKKFRGERSSSSMSAAELPVGEMINIDFSSGKASHKNQ